MIASQGESAEKDTFQPKSSEVLLPNIEKINLRFALPKDFSVLNSPEDPNGFFWGPDGALEKFDADSKDVPIPFIHVIHISDVPESKDPLKVCVEDLKQALPEKFQSSFTNWGSYPVAIISAFTGLDAQYLVIIQTNQKIINLRLVYPLHKAFGNGNFPDENSMNFWKDFLKNTEIVNNK